MSRLKRPALKAMGAAVLVLIVAACASPQPAPVRGGGLGGAGGGGLLGSTDGASFGRKLIEVRGYALSPQDKVPDDSIGYAVPIFTDRDQASRFCPAFRSKLTFEGALDARTPLIVRSYGQTVQIAPFVWPVTSWAANDRPDCKLLVERYNMSGARVFMDLAQQAIAAGGGRPADALERGPFIVTARRVSGAVMVYDLTRAPDNEYGKWLSTSVEQLSNPIITTTVLVRPPLRDRVRAFVFGTIPSWQGMLDVLIPGFKAEHEKS